MSASSAEAERRSPPTTVSHAAPSRRASSTAGTTTTDGVVAAGSNAKDANATGPLPAVRTGSSTSAASTQSAHQRWARLKRSGPETSSRAASPQPDEPGLLAVGATGATGHPCHRGLPGQVLEQDADLVVGERHGPYRERERTGDGQRPGAHAPRLGDRRAPPPVRLQLH